MADDKIMPFTSDDVDAAVTALANNAYLGEEGPLDRDDMEEIARLVLSSTSARGRLLPPGGEVSTHWLVLNVGGFWREGCPDEAAARDLFQRVCDINRGNGSTYEMRRRQVVTTPDGFKAKWPWEVIERSPVVSDNSEGESGG